MSNIGARIKKNIVRPDKALMERFRGIPSSNINDMMNRLFNTTHLECITHCGPLCGPCVTVKAPAGDNAMFHRAMDIAQPGDILVIDAGGCIDRSLAGEMMMRYSALKGIGGWIVDGALRDLDALKDAPFPIYCKGITPQGPYKNGPGEINFPVSCGGAAVLPGDLAVGDEDGVVFIHAEDIELVVEEAEHKFAKEQEGIKAYETVGLEGNKHGESWEKVCAKLGIVEVE